MTKHIFTSPIGKIKILVHEGNILYCGWDNNECAHKYEKILRQYGTQIQANDTDLQLIDEAVKQLQEYFAGEREKFDLSVKVSDSKFREKVWRELAGIKYGETITYKELAERAGNVKAVRAVASACGANPVGIILPCHRVVASQGLGGYTGGLDKKRALLKLEKDCKSIK